MRFMVCGITHIGNIRGINQDNFYCEGCYRRLEEDVLTIERNIVDTQMWMAAVFDGMGGEKDGEIASLIASETSKELSGTKGHVDPGILIATINDRICKERENRKCRMGSTCAFLEFSGNKCRSWNIGDSRTYLYRNKELTQLSVDHTEAAWYASYYNDNSILKAVQESRLTQCLGIPESEFIIEPDVSSWKTIKENDLLMLCSDGLTHYVDDEEICRELKSGETLSDIRDSLLENALGHGGADNITILLIKATD